MFVASSCGSWQTISSLRLRNSGSFVPFGICVTQRTPSRFWRKWSETYSAVSNGESSEIGPPVMSKTADKLVYGLRRPWVSGVIAGSVHVWLRTSRRWPATSGPTPSMYCAGVRSWYSVSFHTNSRRWSSIVASNT